MHSLLQWALGGDFKLVSAYTLEEGRGLIASGQRADLAIVDVDLPDGSGFDFAAELKLNEVLGPVPLIFLTGRSRVDEKVRGFRIGAADYVTKPFEIEELVARIETRLAEADFRSRDDLGFRSGDLNFDLSRQEVVTRRGDKTESLELTSLEYKILLTLARSGGEPVDRESLIRAAWGANVHVVARAVDVQISRLRKKLDASCMDIQSVRGVGYALADPGAGADGKSRRGA